MRQVSGSFGAREGAEARARPRRPYPRAVVLLGVITFCAGCWTGLLIAGVKTFGATRVEAKALEKVNQDFNGSTRFQHAMDFRPNAKFGDCKTYAATKRAKLIEAGWARDRLIVWLALDETGAHHAVLVVDKTTVLDNRFAWTETRKDLEGWGYRFLAPVTWIDDPITSLDDPKPLGAGLAAIGVR